MSLARLREEAIKGDLVNILLNQPGKREIDEGMIPIDIPLDHGLWAYRLGFIRAIDQARIDQVRDIAGLRQLRIGRRPEAVEIRIFEHNKLHLVSTREYDSALQMLERGRFDVLLRPAPALLEEYDRYVSKRPSLTIDRHLIVRYPTALYVYVSKSAPRLAERIRYGLQEMQKDGSLDRHFEAYFSPMAAKLNFAQRTTIELENPFLPAWAKIPKIK
jgi:ABC-type amino acid transport substrate-binding protein